MNQQKGHILVVDDDPSILRSFEKYLLSEHYTVSTAVDGEDGFEKIKTLRPDIVLLDINMPKLSGLELLEILHKDTGTFSPLIIAITAYGDMDAAVKALRCGAYDFLTKPIPLEKLRITIRRCMEKLRLEEQVAHLIDDTAYNPSAVIGRSPLMVELYKKIAALATNRATVFITGESGTGKEIIARAIHDTSSPASPFIPVNCAAIPSNLIESELLGYEKGSFTGADKPRQGKLLAVEDGTLLLDEITELPVEFQAKLLRILQDRTFFPVGSSVAARFNGRIIATSNRDISQEIKEGRFREDLFYRLNVVSLTLPPLRNHAEDIPLLISHFIKKSNAVMHTSIEGITKEAMEFLCRAQWPGNIREIENCVMTAAIHSKDHILTRDSFVFLEDAANDSPEIPVFKPFFSVNTLVSLRELEKQYIDIVLKSENWHKAHSASLLGITRPTLDKKIEEFGLIKDV